MSGRNKQGRPQWIVEQEEQQDYIQSRKITKLLSGTMTPELRYVIEKMRKDYSQYGKTNLVDYALNEGNDKKAREVGKHGYDACVGKR